MNLDLELIHRRPRRRPKALRDPEATIRAFWRNLERLARQPAPRGAGAGRGVAASALHDKP